jgi:hypothetical protein
MPLCHGGLRLLLVIVRFPPQSMITTTTCPPNGFAPSLSPYMLYLPVLYAPSSITKRRLTFIVNSDTLSPIRSVSNVVAAANCRSCWRYRGARMEWEALVIKKSSPFYSVFNTVSQYITIRLPQLSTRGYKDFIHDNWTHAACCSKFRNFGHNHQETRRPV